ncbi:hypothetical protein BC833DRAFT_611811 [Globomyces pollinis-pini]|nr:hypothetical protein BC833DRAFT_611811 [Globomyces pollinis-pini]
MANDFANSAQDALEKGDYANASALHFRAAEQFLLAMNYTTDPEAVKTLKLLYASHTRSGKDLQRRTNTMRNRQPTPTLISKPEPPRATHLYSNVKNDPSKASIIGSRQFFVGQEASESVLNSFTNTSTTVEKQQRLKLRWLTSRPDIRLYKQLWAIELHNKFLSVS